MKKRIILFLILILFPITIIKALDYKETISISNITNVINCEQGYVAIKEDESTQLIKYSNQKIVASKDMNELKNTSIIKYQDSYLLAGYINNKINIYLIDKNLIIKNSFELEEIQTISTINLYSYDNKIYLLQTNDSIISTNLIYEIDENLNTLSKNIATYDSDILKNILNADYYLLHNNMELIENNIVNYKSSYQTANNNYVVGNIEKQEKTDAYIKVYDLNGKIVDSKEEIEYDEFIDITMINNKILVLATKDNISTILIYNSNLVEENKIELNGLFYKFEKTGNLLSIIGKEEIKEYTYENKIYYEESIFGNLNINDKALYNEIVNVEIIPNSGYEVDALEVKDSEGNIMTLENNKFKMPDSDVYIALSYKEKVENPDTIDYIYIFIISAIITLIITRFLRRKLNWLK